MNESSSKPKILIIDDVTENLHILMNILRDDYAVIAATSGEKALQLAANAPMPEVILLDIQMPDMDGYEVLRRLKAAPATSEIPVIFVTALADEENEALGLDLGAVDYITKPISPAITLSRVRNQIDLRQAQSDLLKSQQEAIHAGRLASIGYLASGIAHEINTPAQYISSNLEFMGESFETISNVLDAAKRLTESSAETQETNLFNKTCEPDEIEFIHEEFPKSIKQCREGIDQIANIVQSLKDFSPLAVSEKMIGDIHKAIESVITITHNAVKDVATVTKSFDPNIPKIPCNMDDLRQVFLNIFINSVQAIESTQRGGADLGKITITTKLEREFVAISFADSGAGVPAEIRDHIFDPFFTTKEVGQGTGQGLNICYDLIVNKHGGKIEVGETAKSGAIFTVRLPVTDAT